MYRNNNYRVDEVFVCGTVNLSSIPGWTKKKRLSHKYWYSQVFRLTFGIKRNNVKVSPFVLDMWAGSSLT